MLLTATTSLAVTTSVEFKAGPFSFGDITVNAFNNNLPIALTGEDQTVEATVNDFSIVDARGNNKGWILRVSAEPFNNGTGSTLHEGALKMDKTMVTAKGNSDKFDDNCIISNDITVTSIPQNLIAVPQSKGKGTYTVSNAKFSLTIWPKEVLSTTYTSTVTFELVTNVK